MHASSATCLPSRTIIPSMWLVWMSGPVVVITKASTTSICSIFCSDKSCDKWGGHCRGAAASETKQAIPSLQTIWLVPKPDAMYLNSCRRPIFPPSSGYAGSPRTPGGYLRPGLSVLPIPGPSPCSRPAACAACRSVGSCPTGYALRSR